MLVCAFYKLEVPSYLAVMLPKFCRKVIYRVLGLIKTKLLKIIAPQLAVL
jgi:hypothetical protein